MHILNLSSDHQLFENAFQFASIGIALVSKEGNWLKVNQALCQMLGYTQSELLKFDFQNITHQEDLDEDLFYVKELIEGRLEKYQIEKRYLHKSGRIVWAILSVSIIQASENSPAFFIAQIQDITMLKALQEEIQKNIRKAAGWQMSAKITHEINNPLAVITLNAKAIQMMANEPSISPEGLKQFIAPICKSAERIDKILNNFNPAIQGKISS